MWLQCRGQDVSGGRRKNEEDEVERTKMTISVAPAEINPLGDKGVDVPSGMKWFYRQGLHSGMKHPDLFPPSSGRADGSVLPPPSHLCPSPNEGSAAGLAVCV